MWVRFTERARRVVFFAQEEAGRLGENYVSAEHLLLGLAREHDTVAARILETLGVTLEAIRTEIERQVSQGEGRSSAEMQLTPCAKAVIDYSYEEARLVESDFIGTEHLLLGMIREETGLAGRVLARLGIALEPARVELRKLHDAEDAG
jgi:ATP-dependent Clp protease ATP-binding subunit ClpC